MSFRFSISALILAHAFVSAVNADPSPARVADCLWPIDAYPGEHHTRYLSQVHERVEHRYTTCVQMLVLSSFEGEYSVCLHGTPDDLWFEGTKEVTVTYYAADKNIWYAMPENNEEKVQKEVGVTVSSAVLSLPLAKKVYDLWRRMLLRTRYFEDRRIMLDGVTAEFSAAIFQQGSFYGQTRVPAEGRGPAYLLEVGHLLIKYCKVPPAERPKVARVIEQRLRSLDRHLKAHPAK